MEVSSVLTELWAEMWAELLGGQRLAEPEAWKESASFWLEDMLRNLPIFEDWDSRVAFDEEREKER